jgi:hypothetical protein
LDRYAGFYRAGSAGGSARGYTLVAPSGEGVVALLTGAVEDGARVNVDSAGRISGGAGIAGVSTGEIRSGGIIALNYIPVSGGSAVSFLGAETSAARTPERLMNISSRSRSGGGADSLIAGFVVGGSTSRKLLLRVVGPGLAGFGVEGVLPAARLELYRSGQLVASANDWDEVQSKGVETAAVASQVGAFALKPGSRDSSLLVDLLPGAYTMVAASQTTGSGIALVEAYDADGSRTSGTERLVNIATRARAGAGDAALIAGFVVSGSVPKQLLIRGIGPGLVQFGVDEVLLTTELSVYAGDRMIARNVGWGSASESAAIAAAASKVGAFGLTSGSADSALLAFFAPGAYTAQVTGVGNAAGNALIEVYEVP